MILNKAYKGGIDMKKILIVIDMQNDFIDGVLGTGEAEGIVENVVKKIEAHDGIIYATRDTHAEDYLNTNEGKHLPVKHCIKNTKGWEINPLVEKAMKNTYPAYKIVDKPAFGSLKLAELIKEEAENDEIEVELIGVCTDICVVSNALLIKASLPEIKVSVDESCCAGTTPENHNAAINTMKMCQVEI